MNNDIVKPTPDKIATPIICLSLMFSGRAAKLILMLRYEKNDTPIVFPKNNDIATVITSI